MSQNWLTNNCNTIAIHILTNISRNKDNQTMKTGQPLEYNLRNVFLEKSYTKCGGKTIPRPFSKKSILSIFLDQYSKSLYFLFLLFAKLKTIESDWNKTANPLLLPHIKLKKKKKNRGLELVSLPHFLHDFQRKIFLLLYSIAWPNFNVWLPLFVRYCAICVSSLFVNQVVMS